MLYQILDMVAVLRTLDIKVYGQLELIGEQSQCMDDSEFRQLFQIHTLSTRFAFVYEPTKFTYVNSNP